MASTEDDPSITVPLLASLVPALRALCTLLKVSGTSGMIIGGVAASLQGQARATEDVDAAILLDESSLTRLWPSPRGFDRELPTLSPSPDARQSCFPNTKLLTWALISRSAACLSNGRPLGGHDLVFSIATPEDLIIVKAVAHRPQDLQDIRAVVVANPKLDVPRVRAQVQEFAKALDMPEIWLDIAPLLKKSPVRKARKPVRQKKSESGEKKRRRRR